MSAPKRIRFRVGMGCLGVFLSFFPAIPLIAFLNMALAGNEKPFQIAAPICIPLLLTFLLGRKVVDHPVLHPKEFTIFVAETSETALQALMIVCNLDTN